METFNTHSCFLVACSSNIVGRPIPRELKFLLFPSFSLLIFDLPKRVWGRGNC